MTTPSVDGSSAQPASAPRAGAPGEGLRVRSGSGPGGSFVGFGRFLKGGAYQVPGLGMGSAPGTVAICIKLWQDSCIQCLYM